MWGECEGVGDKMQEPSPSFSSTLFLSSHTRAHAFSLFKQSFSPPLSLSLSPSLAYKQAQISYLEAEACVAALKAQSSQGVEIIPPQMESPPSCDDRGLRLPSTNASQLQDLFLKVSTSKRAACVEIVCGCGLEGVSVQAQLVLSA